MNINYEKLKMMVACTIAVVLIVAACAAGGASGGVAVEEAPYVRVVINGVEGNYSDVPLKINNRVLLPFREILTKLGVPNDDEHIIWNEPEESVTVINGPDKIKITVGKNAMTLNGAEKEFDVAPFFYEKNNRTYVPVRAVSELLDKLIKWEDATTTVYVRDKANYDETLALLEKMRDAKKINKVIANSESKIDYEIASGSAPFPGAGKDGALKASVKSSQLIMADMDINAYHVKQVIDIDGVNIGSEIFYYRDKIFMRVEEPGAKWAEAASQNDLAAGLKTNSIARLLDAAETRPLSDVAMGLALIKGADGTFTIVGEPLTVTEVNSALSEITGMLEQGGVKGYDLKINKYQIGSTIGSDFRAIKDVISADFDISINNTTPKNNAVSVIFKVKIYMTILYEKVGPDFTVQVPGEITALLAK